MNRTKMEGPKVTSDYDGTASESEQIVGSLVRMKQVNPSVEACS
jgi:hypothetical protein